MKNTGRVLTSLSLLGLLGVVAAPVQGQTLADAARREAERRARLEQPTRVITNADIEAVPARGGAAPAALTLAGAAVETAPAETSDAADPAASPLPEVEPPVNATIREKRDEQHWRERAQVIRERLNRLQSDAIALEARVKGLNAEIDSASGSARAGLADDLRQASNLLTRVQGELRLIQGEWRQFEDRAVQDKIPPAWIR